MAYGKLNLFALLSAVQPREHRRPLAAVEDTCIRDHFDSFAFPR